MKLSKKNMFINIGVMAAVFLLIMITGTVEVAAQSAPGPPHFPGAPSAAPIDGGLSLLAAAGGAYAWKKLRDKKEV